MGPRVGDPSPLHQLITQCPRSISSSVSNRTICCSIPLYAKLRRDYCVSGTRYDTYVVGVRIHGTGSNPPHLLVCLCICFPSKKVGGGRGGQPPKSIRMKATVPGGTANSELQAFCYMPYKSMLRQFCTKVAAAAAEA